MKTNNNCARKILLEIEKIPGGETITVDQLQSKIPEFSMEDVLFLVTIFHKENYLNILDKASYDCNDVLEGNKIKGLTERGYNTLDLIRSDRIWQLMTEKLNDFDELSIFTIFNIAKKITNVEQNKIFGLPEDLMARYIRW